MAKQLTVTYNGTDYTLEYNRRTIVQMEKNGFIATDMDKQPGTMIPLLVQGAFMAHHRFVKKELIDEIYDHMTNKEDFIGKLAEMYSEPILALMEDPEGDEGNASWTASW